MSLRHYTAMGTAAKIIVSATIDAATEKVWEFWTEPRHITRWNFATEDWQCPSAENDLRPGGKYKARMEAKDGSFGFDFEAVYDEVSERKRLTYTMSDGRQSTTEFEDLGGRTLVTTSFDPEKENPAEFQQQGWQAILNSFKQYTESN
jgi:uncharacterized protein YndB with AHSA1/START domain